jgi:hypothetical protein
MAEYKLTLNESKKWDRELKAYLEYVAAGNIGGFLKTLVEADKRERERREAMKLELELLRRKDGGRKIESTDPVGSI